MSKLNERNSKTEKVIHIMTTSLCARNCKHCCNKQYSLDDVPYVTDEELRNAETLCLTGGEPFLFSRPCAVAQWYKSKYPNIKKIYVYTNAYELFLYLTNGNKLDYIDGLSVSIKTEADKTTFEKFICNNMYVKALPNNRLYVFDDLHPVNHGNFETFDRVWQEDFKPADDSIFRKI